VSDQTPKRKFRWPWAVAVLAIALLSGVLLVQWTLPAYLESRLLPEIAGEFGLTAQRIDIRRIGLGGADLGPVILSRDGRPSVEIETIRLDFSLPALLSRRIDGLTLIGLHLVATAHTEGLSIAGFDLSLAQPTPASEAGRTMSLKSLLPVAIGQIKIHDAVIDLDWKGIHMPIPLDIDLDTNELTRDRLSAAVMLSPRGNNMRVQMSLDQAANTLGLSLEKAQLRLESLADILELLTPLTATGTLVAKGELQATLRPFAVRSVETSGQLTRTRIQSPHMMVDNVPDTSGQALPMQFEARLQGAGTIDWACGPLRLMGPAEATIEHLNGRFSSRSGQWQLSANSSVNLEGQMLSTLRGFPLLLKQKQIYALDIHARQYQDQGMDFEVALRPRAPRVLLEASIAGHDLSAMAPEMAIKGHYDGQTLESKVDISLTHLVAPMPGGQFECPQLTVTNELTAHRVRDKPRYELHTTLDARNIQAAVESSKASVPEIKLKARITKEMDRPFVMEGNLNFDHARYQDNQKGLMVDRIDLNLPIQWPLSDAGAIGRLHIPAVQYENRPLGGLTGSLFQKGPGVVLKADHRSKLFDGLIVSIHATADVNGAVVDIQVPAYTLPAEMDLGQTFPQGSGYMVNGTIQARGQVAATPSGLKATATASLDKGEVREEESGLHLSGIRGNFSMDDLIHLRSGPGQQLTVDSLQFGNISAADLRIDFQLESAATLLVERAKMQWCKGVVTTNALRVRPEENHYDLTLVCDRLNLAMVLEQLGAAQGSGEGAVNGVIPLRWSEGQLHFDKGFLYSTPGQTGTIHLQGTEMLLAGLPANSPQHTQLDIATEALKDYTYNWAKLSLESDEDLLKIKLQLDGKPNRLLPFGYDQRLGRLKRVKGKGQAEFKGISIDLNFNSPINEILTYREFMQTKQKEPI
jgi:hypothetical protein